MYIYIIILHFDANGSSLALTVGLEIGLVPRSAVRAVGLEQRGCWESDGIRLLVGQAALHELVPGRFDGRKALVEVADHMAFHVLLEQILDRLHDVGCIAGLIGAIGLQEICQCSSHRLEVCIRVGWIGGQVSNAGRCSCRCSCISKNGKQGHCGKHLGNLHCSGERSEPMVQLSNVVNLRASSCADLEPQTNQMQTYMHRISEGIVQIKKTKGYVFLKGCSICIFTAFGVSPVLQGRHGRLTGLGGIESSSRMLLFLATCECMREIGESSHLAWYPLVN